MNRLERLRAEGRFDAINEAIPYTKFVGLECEIASGSLLTIMRHRTSNIGNPSIPAIHGGVVGAALEHAAIMELLYRGDSPELPRTINISIDYLRPARDEDLFMRATIVRHGRRIANVRVEGWQADPARPVAAAHCHFLLSND